jgi:lysophospholipase L1-like esterase
VFAGRLRSGRLVRIAGPLLVTFVLLLAAEAALRVAGFRRDNDAAGDPLAHALPLFRPVAGPDGRAMLQRRDAAVGFLREKPANGFRVFVVGESSAFGYPFGPEFAFSRFLQERLAAALPARTVEVVNAAIPGIGSWQVRRVVDEIAAYRPDVLLVYMGHNELTRSEPNRVSPIGRLASQSRLYQLAAVAAQASRRWLQGPIDTQQMRSQTDPFGSIRDRARGIETLPTSERPRMLARFADNLRAIVATAQTVGARVILASLAQNLSDYPPGASRHRRGLSDAEKQRWRAAVEDADARMRAGDCPAALADLRAAMRIDTQPAILHYLRGRCLEALGHYASARAAYRTASDLDQVPLGAPSALNDVILHVAEETGADFVDVPPALMRSSPHGLLGNVLFYDSIHPTVAGHAALARLFAAALGVPDGGGEGTDVAALLAAHPDIQDQIYRTNTTFYLNMGWHEKALAEITEAGRHYPALISLRQQIEAVAARDPVRSWSDIPDETP